MNNMIMLAVFNHHAARFLLGSNVKNLSEVASLVCPESKLPGRELSRDAPSRDQERNSPRHAYEPHTTVREKYTQEFGREVANYLDDERKKNNYRFLVLVAPPDMLGAMRKSLNKECGQMVVDSYQKNMASMEVEDIIAALPKNIQNIGSSRLGVAGRDVR